MKLPDIRIANLEEKRVLLRADLDVPILTINNKPSSIGDDLRLSASLETINFLLAKNAKVIVAGHLGRPKANDRSLSLEIVTSWYGKHIKNQILKIKYDGFDAWEIGDQFVLLENLRFNPGEEENDPQFAKQLASLADIFVNDAFGSSHRNHASIVGVPSLLPQYAGLHLQKEVEELSKVLENPKRPLTVIIGGAKIETKLPLISKMHHLADYILVGGEIAEHGEELIIPTKRSREMFRDEIKHDLRTQNRSAVLVADLVESKKDITTNSLRNFLQIIDRSETIVWNGPMGFIEEEEYSKTTQEIAKEIIDSGVHSIVGGGDTVGFLNRQGLISNFSFVSTGGGAMLEFLSGENLPGLVALKS